MKKKRLVYTSPKSILEKCKKPSKKKPIIVLCNKHGVKTAELKLFPQFFNTLTEENQLDCIDAFYHLGLTVELKGVVHNEIS
jgi:hypothetical protein